jgi:hypothetical protein
MMLENLKSSGEDATLDLVKLGRTEKLSSVENRTTDLNDLVDLKVRYIISIWSEN